MDYRNSKISDRERQKINDRYRIVESLGRGGMAAVYRVFDEVAKREVALKLLNKEASRNSHLSALFEREFHTLTQLAHPRIIEVYDFGVDARGAYYTMELLDGQDLKKLAPLDWKKACKLLRDVASSLSLLHSRKLLHRDVSSRNVRCTREGRAKLIDFGAMVPFGAPAKVIGTPAFIAPEAFNHQPLDQRTDLYSLGALAYWLITKRYAYRAHAMGQLQDAWRTQPMPLSVVNPDVPKALNDLVMSLLSLDRMARPIFASEVVETLGACAGLEPEDTAEVKQAYLTTPQLVGRLPVIKELRKRVLAMLAGHGGDTILIEGKSGMGRSRLLAELVLEGKVIGATVLTAEAETSARSDYGMAWELLEQLFETAHDLAIDTVKPHLETLSPLFPGLTTIMLSRKSGSAEDITDPDTLSTDIGSMSIDILNKPEDGVARNLSLRPAERTTGPTRDRPQAQKALLDIFLTVNKNRRFVVAIDDIHKADEPSLALLSALALKSQEHTFIIAVTAESDAVPAAPAAYAVLSRVARHIKVTPLDLDATERLLRSIFGDAPNLPLLADRIYAISKGNPRAVIQLAQHLLDRGLVTYQAGAWSLPANIDPGDLPSSLTEAMRAKLHDLIAGAVELARNMALATDQRFSYKECLVLAGHDNGARLAQELNNLVANAVLLADGPFYVLSQSDWVSALTDGITEAREKEGHLLLAKVFSQRGIDSFRTAQYLLKAGLEERALDTFLEHVESYNDRLSQTPKLFPQYVQSLPRDWVQTFERFLTVCQRLKRPLGQRHLLLRSLVGLNAVAVESGQQYLTEVVEQLVHDSGLGIYRERGDPAEGADRLSRALELAQQRYDATPETERGLPPPQAIQGLAKALIAGTGICSTSYDYPLIESLPSLAPFFPLSSELAMIDKNVESTRLLIGSDPEQARQGFLQVLARILQPDHAGIDDTYYEYTRLTVTYAVGIIEASLGLGSALQWVEPLEAEPLFQVSAWRTRAIFYLRQGDIAKALQCKKLTEMLQMQNGPELFFEKGGIFAEFLAYCVSDDLTGVRQTIESIEKMARRFSGWAPILRYGKSELHRIRGDYTKALLEAEETLSLTGPGRHVIWIYAAIAQIRNLFELGRIQEARELGYKNLQAARENNYSFMLHHLGLSLALVEAISDHGEVAVRLAEEAIDYWKALGVTGMTLGLAYETRARVAIYTDDPKSFRIFSNLCAEQYRAGQNATLTAKHGKLIRDARHAYIGLSREARQALELAASLSQSGDLFSGVRAHLASYTTRDERVEGALDLIIKRTGAKNGYLYLAENGELRLACKKASLPPPDNVVESMHANFQRYTDDDGESDASETLTESNLWHTEKSDLRTVESVILSAKVQGNTVPLGSVILCLNDQGQYRPDYQFYEAVARCLYESSRNESESTAKTASACQSRYLIEALLGEGGTASVYAARDRESGKLVALKRVRVEPENPSQNAKERAAATARKKKADGILQHEYQTLKSLVHPRIVEVYDFGVDERGAFYTMELLQGADLRQLAPLDWKKACLFLRDLASALALLHSRKLLHRDVSPRNVRLGADGRIKLMDFGTMTRMGIPKDNVGTPPFIPPEAIYRQPLDQRSDLYSFGALAYWLLTRRHAFPVRRPGELRDAWRTRPPAPSEEVKAIGTLAAIPELLDRLVMSLLSLDPLARPASAGEVMERLNAIADLPVDEQLAVPKAYLVAPTLVGRHEALLLVRKRVIRSLRRRGGAILVEGSEGAGRSRFLDACVMEGKLAGMAVLRTDAKESQREPYAVAQALLRQLFQEIPDVAIEETRPFRNLLRVVVPDLFSAEDETNPTAIRQGKRDGIEVQSPASLQRLRPQIQAALVEYVRAIGRRRSLMIAVDDVDRVDEPSAAFLALLSHEIFESMVVLTLTAECGYSPRSSNSLGIIREEGVVIEMDNLSLPQTETLLISVFGDIPNIQILADKLYSVSDGNPGAVMDLAQYLADQGVVRYHAGAWTLPSDFSTKDLPSGFKETLRSRIRMLDTEALRLAQAMALDLDQRHLFEECVILTGHRDPSRVARSLDALIAAGIISTDGKRYGLHLHRFVPVLLDDLTQEDKRQLHLRLAELYESHDNDQYFLARHLLFAGQGKRALSVFIGYIEKAREQFALNKEALQDFISEPPREWEDTLLGLYQICDKFEGTRYQRYLIQHTIAILSSVRVIPDKTHLLAVVQQLYHDCGLDIYEQLAACDNSQERLVKALDLAQRRYETGADPKTVLSPAFALSDFPAVLLAVLSILGASLDYELVELIPPVAPLHLISVAFGLFDKGITNSRHTLAGRLERAREGYLEVLKRTAERPDGMCLSDVLVSRISLGAKFAAAIIESSWGLDLALKRASELETNPSFKLNACQLRMLYYLRQGDVQKAGHYKKQLELLRVQTSLPYFEGTPLLSEMYSYSFSDDLIGIKRTIDEIETMANRFDAWIPVLHFARGEYHRIRGDFGGAVSELEQSFKLVTVGRHLVWPYLAGAYINTLFEAGRFEASQEAGRKLISDAETADLGVSCNFMRTALARTEAKLGQYEIAVAHADSAIASWKALGASGINIGLAYESRARVAYFMNDQESFHAYAALCAEQYQKGRNPALIAKHERLIREAHEAGIETLSYKDAPTENDARKVAQEDLSGIDTQMRDINDPERRADFIIKTLARHSGAKDGYLFGLQKGGVKNISTHQRTEECEQLIKLIQTYLEAELAESSKATVTVADQNAAHGESRSWVLENGTLFEPLLLYETHEERTIVVGVAALIPKDEKLREVSPAVIYAVSEALVQSGDVFPLEAAG